MKPIPAKIKDKFALKKWCVAHKVNVLHGFRVLVPRNGTICQAQIKKMQAQIRQYQKAEAQYAALLKDSPGIEVRIRKMK